MQLQAIDGKIFGLKNNRVIIANKDSYQSPAYLKFGD